MLAIWIPPFICDVILERKKNKRDLLHIYLNTCTASRCRVVESVGKDVYEVKEGDTVIPIFMADCGECTDCLSEKSNLCSKLPFKLASGMPRCGTSRFTDLNGEVLHHLLSVSSFSEYTVVDIANILKVDPAIPPNRACLLSCGVATGHFQIHWSLFTIVEILGSSSISCCFNWAQILVLFSKCGSCSFLLENCFTHKETLLDLYIVKTWVCGED